MRSNRFALAAASALSFFAGAFAAVGDSAATVTVQQAYGVGYRKRRHPKSRPYRPVRKAFQPIVPAGFLGDTYPLSQTQRETAARHIHRRLKATGSWRPTRHDQQRILEAQVRRARRGVAAD